MSKFTFIEHFLRPSLLFDIPDLLNMSTCIAFACRSGGVNHGGQKFVCGKRKRKDVTSVKFSQVTGIRSNVQIFNGRSHYDR